MAFKFDLKLTSFEKFLKRLLPKPFESRLHKHIGKATRKNALVAEGEIKRDIRAGKYTPNAEVTTILKGSSRPLVDTGELFKSVVGKLESWDVALIGVLKNKITKRDSDNKPKDILSIAYVLHFGAKIRVTDKMRRYFYALAKKHPGVIPLSIRKRFIIIPPRPFLKAAIKPEMLVKYRENWLEALDKVFKGVE